MGKLTKQLEKEERSDREAEKNIGKPSKTIKKRNVATVRQKKHRKTCENKEKQGKTKNNKMGNSYGNPRKS